MDKIYCGFGDPFIMPFFINFVLNRYYSKKKTKNITNARSLSLVSGFNATIIGEFYM